MSNKNAKFRRLNNLSHKPKEYSEDISNIDIEAIKITHHKSPIHSRKQYFSAHQSQLESCSTTPLNSMSHIETRTTKCFSRKQHISEMTACNTARKVLNIEKLGLLKLPKFSELYEELLCSGNKISSIELTEDMHLLEILRMDDNIIRFIPPSIKSLKNLRELSIEGNLLLCVPKEICNCVSLCVLKLSRNKLEGLPIEISNLTLLSTLEIQNNIICRLPVSMYLLSELSTFGLEWFYYTTNKVLNDNEESIFQFRDVCLKCKDTKKYITFQDYYLVAGISNNYLLHSACQMGHTAIVHGIINTGANINQVNANGKTPLQIAVESNMQKVAMMLLEQKAIHTNDPIQTYGCLINQCIKLEQFNIVFKLINFDLLKKNYNDCMGNTPFHYILTTFNTHPEVSSKLYDALVKKGLNPNETNYLGATPLEIAILQEQDEAVDFIFRNYIGTATHSIKSVDFKKFSKAPITSAVFLSSRNIYIKKYVNKAQHMNRISNLRYAPKLSSINKLTLARHNFMQIRSSQYSTENSFCKSPQIKIKLTITPSIGPVIVPIKATSPKANNRRTNTIFSQVKNESSMRVASAMKSKDEEYDASIDEMTINDRLVIRHNIVPSNTLSLMIKCETSTNNNKRRIKILTELDPPHIKYRECYRILLEQKTDLLRLLLPLLCEPLKTDIIHCLNMLGYLQLPYIINKKKTTQFERSEQLHMYALNGLYHHSRQYLPQISKAIDTNKTMSTSPQKAYDYFKCN